MFGKRDDDFRGDRVEMLLGSGALFRGSIVSSGVVRIEGKVEGDITHNGELMIGEPAHVTATIKAGSVTIAGEVRGNVECEGRLELTSTGRLYGDIKVGQLVVQEGAVFQGNSNMRGKELPNLKPAPKPA